MANRRGSGGRATTCSGRPDSGGFGGAPVEGGDVAVEALDVVEAAGLVGEDVHHHVAEVDQHPLLLGDTLDAHGASSELLAHLVLDLVGNGADQAAVRRAR